MSALPAIAPRTEIRCPHCGMREAVQLSPGTGLVELKCRRQRCGKAFVIDLATGKPVVTLAFARVTV